MKPDEIPKMIGELSKLYGWALTNTETLALRAALSAHDRVTVSTAAGAANAHRRNQGQPMTSADLIAALRARATATQPIRKPPPPATTPEQRRALTTAALADVRAKHWPDLAPDTDMEQVAS